MNTQRTFKLIWTAAAIAKHESGKSDPRHTISQYPADPDSPWFGSDMARHLSGKPWILLDGDTIAFRSA